MSNEILMQYLIRQKIINKFIFINPLVKVDAKITFDSAQSGNEYTESISAAIVTLITVHAITNVHRKHTFSSL